MVVIFSGLRNVFFQTFTEEKKNCRHFLGIRKTPPTFKRFFFKIGHLEKIRIDSVPFNDTLQSFMKSPCQMRLLL